MDVNKRMSYECSDEGTSERLIYAQNIHNLLTRSHASEEENRPRNRRKNASVNFPVSPSICKCEESMI